MNDIMLSTLIEALALNKEQIEELNDLLSLLQDETKSNQDEIVKTKEILTAQIEDLLTSTRKMIEGVRTSIKPQSVDYSRIEVSIKAKINRFMTEKNQDIAELRADLKDWVLSLSPTKPSETPSFINNYEIVIKELKDYILSNKQYFKGEDGNTPVIKDGKDGVGIQNITYKNGSIVIDLTDGTTKSFKINIPISFGGGGISETRVQQLIDNALLEPTLTWDYLVNNWSEIPTENSDTGSGIIYNYTLKGVTRFRYVPNDYDPTLDAFYSDLALTNLIVARG